MEQDLYREEDPQEGLSESTTTGPSGTIDRTLEPEADLTAQRKEAQAESLGGLRDWNKTMSGREWTG